MYIEANDKDMPGYESEKQVMEAIKSAYGDTLIGIHHFPMFSKNGKNHKEIDILLIDKTLGLTAIEVKGLYINQITHVTAHNWYYKNFYIEKGNPFEQVRNQMYMLQNYLEENPVLYHRFSRRTLVALPHITSKEWESKKFENSISIPPILFKDDLANSSKLKFKISNSVTWESPTPLSEIQWKELLKKLGIGQEKSLLNQYQNFSSLYVINNLHSFMNFKKQIRADLLKGTKVYILSYVTLADSNLNVFDNDSLYNIKNFIDEFQYLIFFSNNINRLSHMNVAYDGASIIDNKSLQEIIKEDFPSFNMGQYLAIHSNAFTHEIVTAGAGTGKTHVMIDRIMFLLIHENIKLSLIDMITFTNESTNEMKSRLEKRLISLYKLTKQPKFLFYAEDVSDMTISTIHKYAKSILKRLAHEIGYGQNLSVSSFISDKKVVIEKLLNSYLIGDKLKDFYKCKIQIYDLVNIIYSLWNKMEVKGLSTTDILNLNWGEAESEEAIILQDIFIYIFSRCESELEFIKKKKNAISTGDLIRKLKEFTNKPNTLNQLTKNRFVFIDEFQDSDAVQIELFASLANHLDYKLFVVGDLKQSIYRFRGADYKSFKELTKAIHSNEITDISLNQSYRSTNQLLDRLHFVFEKWAGAGLLEYNPVKDRLYGNKKSSFSKNIHINNDILETITTAISNLPNSNEKLALIVRTNKQARLVKEICIENNINTSENLDGTFYTSDTVLHFNILLKALLYPNEPKYLIDLLQTPYFGYVIPYQKLVEFNGCKDSILKYIHATTNNFFNVYVRNLKTKSPLAIFHEIVYEYHLLDNLEAYYKEKKSINDETQVEHLVKKYERNLQHLITQVEKTFDSRNAELFAIEKWLMIQIKTNRQENEPMLNNDKIQVEITTVHRSKGLEYNTVILPYTSHPFAKLRSEFYFQEEPDLNKKTLENRRIGWQIDKSSGNRTKLFQNNHYKSLFDLDMSEMKKEEARLLYVAMTRAIDQLYIVMNNRISSDTWAGLLSKGGLKK